jgi:hypothetical protein
MKTPELLISGVSLATAWFQPRRIVMRINIVWRIVNIRKNSVRRWPG